MEEPIFRRGDRVKINDEFRFYGDKIATYYCKLTTEDANKDGHGSLGHYIIIDGEEQTHGIRPSQNKKKLHHTPLNSLVLVSRGKGRIKKFKNEFGDIE